MAEVKVGQRWRGNDGIVVEVEMFSTGGLGVRQVDRCDVPLIRIMPDVFARHHTLVEYVGGSPPPAPAQPEFKVGDVVRLKCGGPPMVVADTAAEYNAREFDADGKPREGRHGNMWLTYGTPEPYPPGHVRVQWHKDNGEMTWTWIASALLVPSAVVVDTVPGEPVDWPLPTDSRGNPIT